MIQGLVNAQLEPTIRIRIRGPAGVEIELEALIDTGFTSFLTLPSIVISALGLTQNSTIMLTLGDGTAAVCDLYDAEIEWDGVWRAVEVSEMGDEVLVGLKLLADHEVKMTLVPHGRVMIEAIP